MNYRKYIPNITRRKRKEKKKNRKINRVLFFQNIYIYKKKKRFFGKEIEINLRKKDTKIYKYLYG